MSSVLCHAHIYSLYPIDIDPDEFGTIFAIFARAKYPGAGNAIKIIYNPDRYPVLMSSIEALPFTMV